LPCAKAINLLISFGAKVEKNANANEEMISTAHRPSDDMS